MNIMTKLFVWLGRNTVSYDQILFFHYKKNPGGGGGSASPLNELSPGLELWANCLRHSNHNHFTYKVLAIRITNNLRKGNE